MGIRDTYNFLLTMLCKNKKIIIKIFNNFFSSRVYTLLIFSSETSKTFVRNANKFTPTISQCINQEQTPLVLLSPKSSRARCIKIKLATFMNFMSNIKNIYQTYRRFISLRPAQCSKINSHILQREHNNLFIFFELGVILKNKYEFFKTKRP